MWKKIILGLVGLIVLLVLIGFVLPREVSMDRSIVIDAPPDVVYPHLASLKASQKWSPWAEKDPNAKYTFEGPESGVGNKMSWTGNDDVGTGAQEITAVEVNKSVTTALDFGEQGTAIATFTLEPSGTGTKVTWGFVSDMGGNPIGRWFGLFLESMLAPDYEKGLSNLKALVEKKS